MNSHFFTNHTQFLLCKRVLCRVRILGMSKNMAKPEPPAPDESGDQTEKHVSKNREFLENSKVRIEFVFPKSPDSSGAGGFKNCSYFCSYPVVLQHLKSGSRQASCDFQNLLCVFILTPKKPLFFCALSFGTAQKRFQASVARLS